MSGNEHDFERFLKQRRVPEAPAQWRAEILATARQKMKADGGRMKAEPERPWWLAWMWPSPVAWGALACVWIVIWISTLGGPGPQPPPVASAGGETFITRLALERSLAENKGGFGL